MFLSSVRKSAIEQSNRGAVLLFFPPYVTTFPLLLTLGDKEVEVVSLPPSLSFSLKQESRKAGTARNQEQMAFFNALRSIFSYASGSPLPKPST